MNKSKKVSSSHKSVGEILADLPWKYIIYVWLGIAVAYAVIKFIQAVKNIAGPALDTLGQLLKDTVGLLNPCITQVDCSLDTCDKCNKSGCDCTPDGKSCRITSGKKVGEGGLINLNCILDWFLLTPLIFAVIGFLWKLYPRKANPVIEDMSKFNGKSPLENTKDIYDKANADIEKAKEDYKKENGKEMPKELEDALKRVHYQSGVTDAAFSAFAGKPGTETFKADAKAQYEKIIQDVKDKVEKAEQDKELSKEDREFVDKEIDRVKPRGE